MPGTKIIPVGEMQGRIAVRVDVSDVDLDDDVALTQKVLASLVPGAVAVELVNAPWGVIQLDRSIHMLLADGRTSELEIWALRSVMESRWSSAPMWWCIDASPLFATGVDAATLVHNINALSFLPQPAELVIKNAHAQSIAHVLLDEIATRLDPGVCWLYLDPTSQAWDTAEREIARCTTPWGLRSIAP